MEAFDGGVRRRLYVPLSQKVRNGGEGQYVLLLLPINRFSRLEVVFKLYCSKTKILNQYRGSPMGQPDTV